MTCAPPTTARAISSAFPAVAFGPRPNERALASHRETSRDAEAAPAATRPRDGGDRLRGSGVRGAARGPRPRPQPRAPARWTAAALDLPARPLVRDCGLALDGSGAAACGPELPVFSARAAAAAGP